MNACFDALDRAGIWLDVGIVAVLFAIGVADRLFARWSRSSYAEFKGVYGGWGCFRRGHLGQRHWNCPQTFQNRNERPQVTRGEG